MLENYLAACWLLIIVPKENIRWTLIRLRWYTVDETKWNAFFPFILYLQVWAIQSTKANVVVSSPETLLNYTKAVFSKWLDQCALAEKSLCEASTSNIPLKDEEEENWGYSHQFKDRFSGDQTEPGAAVSLKPLSVFICLALFSVLCFAQSIFWTPVTALPIVSYHTSCCTW